MRTADTAAFVSDKAVLLVLKQVSEAIILPRYKRLSDADISTKTDANDFVTVADREAEADISTELLKMLPGSRCIGPPGRRCHPDRPSNSRKFECARTIYGWPPGG